MSDDGREYVAVLEPDGTKRPVRDDEIVTWTFNGPIVFPKEKPRKRG